MLSCTKYNWEGLTAPVWQLASGINELVQLDSGRRLWTWDTLLTLLSTKHGDYNYTIVTLSQWSGLTSLALTKILFLSSRGPKYTHNIHSFTLAMYGWIVKKFFYVIHELIYVLINLKYTKYLMFFQFLIFEINIFNKSWIFISWSNDCNRSCWNKCSILFVIFMRNINLEFPILFPVSGLTEGTLSWLIT